MENCASKVEVAKAISKEELEKLALDNEAVKRFVADGTILKVIVVPGRLVNDRRKLKTRKLMSQGFTLRTLVLSTLLLVLSSCGFSLRGNDVLFCQL